MYCYNDEIKACMMGETCSTPGENEKLQSENLKGREHLRDLVVDGFECILKGCEGVHWIIFLRVGASGGLY
jgi:hypothetical protein